MNIGKPGYKKRDTRNTERSRNTRKTVTKGILSLGIDDERRKQEQIFHIQKTCIHHNCMGVKNGEQNTCLKRFKGGTSTYLRADSRRMARRGYQGGAHIVEASLPELTGLVLPVGPTRSSSSSRRLHSARLSFIIAGPSLVSLVGVRSRSSWLLRR